MVKVGVVGGGSWGTALANILAEKGIHTEIYVRDNEQGYIMKKERENKKYLPGVILSDKLIISDSVEETIRDKELILLSIPSHTIRAFLLEYKDIIEKEQIIVNSAKGIENESLKTISEIVAEVLPENNYVVLSGPSHAEEVGRKMPTTVVSASEKIELAEYIQDVFMTPYFRVYTNTDVKGVELGGSLKNVIALGAGIADGLGYGDNTKAALMTRGIIEISRLGKALGANPLTFTGLAGVGDLIVTCTSMHSRNRKAGILIGEGNSLEETVEKVGMVVEGIKTTKSTYKLSKIKDIEMPITEEIYKVLYEGADVDRAVINLMKRDKKSEIEYSN